MNLFSVNLGKERVLIHGEHVEHTGIFKFPTTDPVTLTKLGLEGDVIVSKKHHGGPDQAVYVYGTLDYDWWAKELSKACPPGMFGENLTISGLESAQFNIGDYLHIGDAILQITAPRIPCATFAARMEDPQWVKKFRRAEKPGLYCRVIQEGTARSGTTVSIEKYAGETISILELFREYYNSDKSEGSLRRQLNAPIAVRARVDVLADLEKLNSR